MNRPTNAMCSNATLNTVAMNQNMSAAEKEGGGPGKGWHWHFEGEPWNFVTGCEEVSPGCFLCYARSVAEGNQRRLAGADVQRRAQGKPGLVVLGYQKDGVQTKQGPSPGSTSPGFGFELRPDLLVPGDLKKIPTGGKTRRVFVDSMSDLFQASVPPSYIADFYEAVRHPKRQDTRFMVQTKRATNMKKMVSQVLNGSPAPPNVWLGVTVENADPHVLDRIRHLRDLKQSAHAVRTFISFEPLLGLLPDDLDLSGIDWAYVGGESPQSVLQDPITIQNCKNAGCHFTSSGQVYRPMNPDWVRRVRDLLVKHDIPFLFKQWGAPSNNPDPANDPSFRGDPHGGCQLDGQFFDWCP